MIFLLATTQPVSFDASNPYFRYSRCFFFTRSHRISRSRWIQPESAYYHYDASTNRVSSISPSQWTFEWTSGAWAIKSAGLGTYIGLSGTAANGTSLAAVSSPVTWDIWFDSVTPSNYRFVKMPLLFSYDERELTVAVAPHRLFVHNTTQNWDLADFGNSTPGTHVQTWARWSGVHQTWSITRGWNYF